MLIFDPLVPEGVLAVAFRQVFRDDEGEAKAMPFPSDESIIRRNLCLEARLRDPKEVVRSASVGETDWCGTLTFDQSSRSAHKIDSDIFEDQIYRRLDDNFPT